MARCSRRTEGYCYLAKSPADSRIFSLCARARAREEKMFCRGLMGVLARWGDDQTGTAGEK